MSSFDIFIPIHLHRLTYITLALMASICVQTFAYPYNMLYVAISIAAPFIIILSLYDFSKELQKTFLLIAMASCAGMLQTYLQQQQHCAPFTGSNKSPATIYATITDIAHIDNNRYNYKITAYISSIKTAETSTLMPCNKSILIYLREYPALRIADKIEICNIILKAPPAAESFSSYLCKEGINATAFLHSLDYALLDRPSWSIKRWFFEWRAEIYTKLQQKISPACFALFSSLFLGNRHEQKQTLEPITQQFQQWGIVHHLARSGLHLVLFAATLLFLLRYVPISLFTKKIFMLVFCFLYFFLSWSSLPFLRSFTTFVLNAACCFLGVTTHTLYLITLICFITLLINPIQLFFLDFQLTFLITYAIAWFNYCYPSYRYLNTPNYCSH